MYSLTALRNPNPDLWPFKLTISKPVTLHVLQILLDLEVPARYSEGPLFRKSIVQIRVTMITFGLRVRLGLGLRLEWALGLGLELVGIDLVVEKN